MEASVIRILDQIRNCLEIQESGTILSLSYKEQTVILKINSQLAGLPFLWQFVCSPADKKKASENLIVPLMAMVGELTRRQRELVKMLKSKDKEIDDYKAQGVKASRKHIETQEFVETAFENTMLMSKGFEEEVYSFGKDAFNEAGQDLYRQIMTKYAWLNKDEKDLNDLNVNEETNSPGGASWGTNRLPPSVQGPKSLSPSRKSPNKSPVSSKSNTPDASPLKDTELMRRQALERRLESEESKKQEKNNKKKKMAF